MSIHSEIDETLRLLGSVEPPPGLERRVNLRLQISPQPFFHPDQAFYAACALAASVALSAVALNPALRSLVFHQHSAAQATRAIDRPASSCPRARGVWDRFCGSRARRAGSGAAHAG